MKIVLSIRGIYDIVGGAERAIIGLANELHDRGHKVIFLITQADVKEKSKPHYQLNNNISVINLYQTVEEMKQDRSDLKKIIKKLFRFFFRGYLKTIIKIIYGLTFKAFRLDKFLWHRQHDWIINGIRHTITTINPDIVVSFMPYSFVIIFQALKDTNIPFVVANRNDPFVDYTLDNASYNHYLLGLRKKASEFAVANLVQLESYKNYFSGEVQKKTFVIPNSAPYAMSVEVAQVYNTAGMKTIICAGRYHHQKNISLLIRSFAMVANKYPDWQVKIFGEGELEIELKRLIKKLKVSESVLLMGSTGNMSVEYSNSHIFAFPSLFEGFSNALIEAISHGLPSIVIMECTGNRELVLNGNCGLIAENNVTDFAEKLQQLMNDPELRKSLGENSIKFVNQFEPGKIYNLWERVLTDAASHSSKNRIL